MAIWHLDYIRPNHIKSALGGATYIYARLRFVSP